MNLEIQVYKHPQFGEIRTMTMPDGQVGFVGKDVAEVLGYQNPTKACRVHVLEEDRLMSKMDTSFGVKETLFGRGSADHCGAAAQGSVGSAPNATTKEHNNKRTQQRIIEQEPLIVNDGELSII